MVSTINLVVFHRGKNGESPPCLSQSSLFHCRSTEFVTCPQSIWSYSIVVRMANLQPVSLNRLSFIVDQQNFDGVHDQSGVFHRGENGESPPCLSQSSLFHCRSTEFGTCPQSIWSYSIVVRMVNLHPVSFNRRSFIVDQPNFDGVHDQSGRIPSW